MQSVNRKTYILKVHLANKNESLQFTILDEAEFRYDRGPNNTRLLFQNNPS